MSINLSFYPVLNRQYVLVRQYGDSIIYPLMSDDEYAISSPEHKYIRINRTAAEILSLCNGEYSVLDIINNLCALYEMENQENVHEIVSDFITDSVDRGYVNMQMKCGTGRPVKIYGDYSMITPVFACLEVTKRCPLKCKHCYNNSGSIQGYEMNLEEIKQVLNILSEIGVQKLMLTGGEATARTDFIDIVEYAYSKFVAISIASNGYLMDESLIKQLASFRNKIVVQISIDGSEEHHNLIRGKEDSYRKAIRAVKLLRMNSVPVIVATTLNSTNFPDMEAVAKAAYEAGALQIIYAITTDQGRARKNHLAYGIDLKDFASRAIELKQKYLPKGFYVLIEDDTLARINDSTTQHCKAGITQIAIRENGDVAPCLCFFYTYGNILRDELRDLFSPERSEKFKKLPSPNVEYCGNCEELENCQQCPARAYDAKNNDCRWKKDFIEIMEN